MIGLIAFLIVFVVVGIILGIFKRDNYRDAETGRVKVKTVGKLITAAVIAFILSLINPIDVERIDAGHVGIKVSNVGDNRGVGRTEYVTGWVFYNSWISRIYEFPIHQQHIDYEEADIVTRGGFRATIRPSFNYSI
jgi:hypothetical protein